MAISTYDKNQFLIGFDHLFGKRIELEYLATERSRKWKSANIRVNGYSKETQDDFEKLAKDNGWHSWRVVDVDSLANRSI
jgi:hypothetical protein